jgi:colanic acid biosynthesis glycosyl transferase WcaI
VSNIIKALPVHKKTILLISHNFSPEPTGIGKVNGEMIHWLANEGFRCTVITTFPYYPHWKIQAPYKNRWFKREDIDYPDSKGSITIYRCPFYIPSKPTGKKRMIQDFSYWAFMSWVAGMFVVTKKKYDLIITIAPPVHLGYLGLLIKNKMGGKLIYHIQDMQIESAQKLDMISNKMILDYAYKIEKKLLTKADFVSCISPGMIAKIKTKVDRDVIYFPNWVDIAAFYPVNERNLLKVKWGYKNDDIVFLYSGAIGEKQGLESIILTAEELKCDKRIKFIICGTSPYKHKLMVMAGEKNLRNLAFLPVQDKEVFNEFLNMADYHLVLQKGSVSDLGMPSKLATILAVGGVSIATTAPNSSLYNLIHGHNLGYVVDPDNHHSLSKLILDLKTLDHYEQKRANARNYATQYLNIDNILKGLLVNVFN